MKRIVALLMVVMCLLLTACSNKDPDPTQPSSQTGTTAPVTTTTEAIIQNQTLANGTGYRHPLNGSVLENVWTGRATAVVINNHSEALPQHGINSADILYEFETEGGITRRLGIFSDLSSIDKIGPVRSARTYFLSAAESYDAPLVHCGGSKYAKAAQYDKAGNTISNWAHIDAAVVGTYFFRDEARLSSGYAYEHTLFTTGEKVLKALANNGYNTTSDDGTAYGLNFDENPQWQGSAATEVTISFYGGKKTVATYNEQTGKYAISQYGAVGVDGNTGEKLESRNVIAIFADQSKNGVHSFYDMIGSGEGYLACDGKIIPIKWQRSSVDRPYTYTTQDGAVAVLGVGNSYIALLDGSVSYK